MARILLFGPSMVDIRVILPDHKVSELHNLVNVVPGDWVQVHDYEIAQEILRLVSPSRAAGAGGERCGAPGVRDIQRGVSAGSSTLNMLSAMPGSLRGQAVYASATAVLDGAVDNFASFFATEVLKTGASHLAFIVCGHSPICLVVRSQSNPEKALISYRGVSDQFAGCDVDALSPDLIMIDSYELFHGPFADFLNSLISAGRYNVALSLGSHTILRGRFLERVRFYLERGLIYILCGNLQEYQSVFPELDGALIDSAQFRNHRIGQLVRYALVTDGPRCMAAYWAGAYVQRDVEPLHPDEIVNTAGAGDTAAGVFCASVLQGLDPAAVLTLADDRARRVLIVGASRLEFAD